MMGRRMVCNVIDVATGAARSLTQVRGHGGDDSINQLRFSPDGRWLLVSSALDFRFVLVEVETGRMVDVPCFGETPPLFAAWWPQHGPSSLLATRVEEETTILQAVDLATGERAELGVLALPHGSGTHEGSLGVQDMALAPDGRALLGLSYAVSARDADRQPRPRWRLVRGEPLGQPANGVAGHVADLRPAYLDPGAICVVQHTRARWLDQTAGARVTVAPELLETAA